MIPYMLFHSFHVFTAELLTGTVYIDFLAKEGGSKLCPTCPE
jgi:hypothetical protein